MSIETSAKAGHNVKTLFKKIAMALPGGNSELKDPTANQSKLASLFRLGRGSKIVLISMPEIDVSTAKGDEVPAASSCSC
jgi:Ras-related protein Rab-6A